MKGTRTAAIKHPAKATPAKKEASKGAKESASLRQVQGGPEGFDAALERAAGGLGWTIARVPFDVHAAFPAMLRLRVKGTIAGPGGEHAFRTSLFPLRSLEGDLAASHAEGSFFLLVNKAMQRGAGVTAGAVARFTLEADLDERPAELPDALAAMLGEEPGLRGFYDSLSESWRREIGKWIAGVKSAEAQFGRCEQMAERLLHTMEAEAELPPLIERAFRMRPKARAGWEKMTPVQRRQELLGVFYYRTPESRQKRLEKLCETAEAKV